LPASVTGVNIHHARCRLLPFVSLTISQVDPADSWTSCNFIAFQNLVAHLVAAIPFIVTFVEAGGYGSTFNLKPFKIDLTDKIPRLRSLVNYTRLPDKSLYPDAGSEEGIELDVLRELRRDWLTKFDWEAQQAELIEPFELSRLTLLNN
jgi:hypothetical protein